jgi:hypothetical protein
MERPAAAPVAQADVELGETIAAAFPGIGLEAEAVTDRVQGLIAKGALLCPSKTELFDGILDVLVVTTGAGTSTGFPMAEGWDEVFRSNMAKVDRQPAR